MPTTTDMTWFKNQFHTNVAAAVAGTPFDLDMLTALASQETGFIWGALSRKGLPTQQILDLCVGDVITGPKRSAFPTSAAALKAWSRGPEMYALARQELKAMAAKVGGYSAYVDNPERFCHAFGIFQYDLQFFRTTPDYFLNRDYADIDKGLKRAVGELRAQQSRIPTLAGKTNLTDLELAAVAIAYNTGRFKPALGLKQGHKNIDGRYYGELFYDYLRKARTIPNPGAAAVAPKPPAGQAPVPPPSPITAAGDVYRVDTLADPLLLRKAAAKTAAVVERLPDGQLVRAFGDPATNGYLRVQTSVKGARIEGYAAVAFLVKEPAATIVPVIAPTLKPPKKGVVAVHAPPRKSGFTVRAENADARSLNEPGQKTRSGASAAQRVAELGAIIDWLDVADPKHRRYAPRDGLTFCNIYAHDFCHLAGIYLPRVWWTGQALVQLGQGKTVEPAVGTTANEIRANELLAWLDDFGPDFGWRRTSSLSVLQAEANQGAVGLVVARRVNSKGPGHIAVAVPETDTMRARRDAAGEVTLPVLSQAGAKNVNRGPPANAWWANAAKFETHAYWLHA